MGKNKIQAINMYALLIIRYFACILTWPNKDMKAANVKIWKLLTMYGGVVFFFFFFCTIYYTDTLVKPFTLDWKFILRGSTVVPKLTNVFF